MVIGIILARILGPEPFGALAAALVVIGLGNLVADMGFGASIIQKKDVSVNDIRFAFTAQLLLGIFLFISVFFSAEYISVFFKQKVVKELVQAVSFMFILQAFGQVSTSLLRREMNFKYLQISQIVSYLVSYIVFGVPMALFGFGVWSLVVAQLIQSGLSSLLTYLRLKHSLMPSFRNPNLDMAHFGVKIIAANLTSWMFSCIDVIFIGRCYGPTGLGIYNRPMSIIGTPIQSFVSLLQQVLFPVFSRVQDRRNMAQKAFLVSSSLIALLFLPIYSSLATISTTFVFAIFGDKWTSAIPLLFPLSLAMPVRAMSSLVGPLLESHNKAIIEIIIQVVVGGIMLILFFSFVGQGLVFISWIILLVYILRLVALTKAGLGLLNIPINRYLSLFNGPVFLSAVVAIFLFVIDQSLTAIGFFPVVRLMVCIISAGILTLQLVRSFPNIVFNVETKAAIFELKDKIPSWFFSLIFTEASSKIETKMEAK